MKKLLLGVAAIAIITSASVAGANGLNSLIGKKVTAEATVNVNGKQVSDAIIIDGKSYAPVRDVVEAVGGTVKYSAGNGGKASINIEKKDSSIASLESALAIVDRDLQSERASLTSVLNEIEKYTIQKDEQIAGLTDQATIDALNRRHEGFVNERNKLVDSINKRIAELEVKRDELRKQLESAK